LSHPLPANSVIQSLTVKRTVSGWFACFAVELELQPLPSTKSSVGSDVGVENLASLSDGVSILNCRFYQET
jgi:putative transposase